MILVPITNIPNQSLSIRLDDNFYDIDIFMCATGVQETPFFEAPIMAMNLSRNGTAILTGQRLVAGFPAIPYRYLEDGNFVIITDDDDLPDYNEFGITQFLIYASAAEIAALRAGT